MLLYYFMLGALIALPIVIIDGTRAVWRAHRERRLGWGTYYLVIAIVIVAFAI